tara:strand:+ start:222 stop:860 length:639 start_codon:yes stop_codon:yes gene_type:complete
MSESNNTAFQEERFYDDLEQTLETAWMLLSWAATDRRSPMHTPVLANTGIDGSVSARTAVLRHVDRQNRRLRIHTDVRSPKIEQLTRRPQCQVVAYHPGHKVQLRMEANASIHNTDPTARDIWRQTSLSSRRCYLAEHPPGTPSPVPTSALPDAVSGRVPDESESEPGFGQFAVLLITIDTLEWLYLAARGHRRARFNWTASNGLESEWLTP